MRVAYCGKSCKTCGYRMATGCRGCREEAGWECKLARCCREKGHESCESCTYSGQCGIYRGKDAVPQFRLAKKKAELEHQMFLQQRGAFLGKRMWVLFWLFVPASIATGMREWIPGLEMVGYLLSFACMAVYGGILLNIAREDQRYGAAGMLTVVAAALSLATIAANHMHPLLLVIISLAHAVVVMFGCYYECNAHADVLEGVDNEQSEQWRRLWKWMLGATIAMVMGLMFTLLLTIAALVVVATAITMLVLNILKLVYLYRTAQIFRDIAAG